jgi:predicted porin
MIALKISPRARGPALLLVAMMAAAPHAWAQGNVGNGPMTGTLPETEPTTGAFTVGRFKVAPGFVIREIGHDDNVFNEEDVTERDRDFVVAVTPDLSAFSRLRWAKLSGYSGLDLTYFHEFEGERSVGYSTRGRIDILLSRMRPFVSGGRMQARNRPNGEVDARANRIEDELSGGLAYDWGEFSAIYVAGYRMGVKYKNALEDGVDIGDALTRDQYEYSAGLRTALTPLASLTLYGAFRQDRFRIDKTRDGDSRSLNGRLAIGAEAAVSGQISLGFTDFKPVDPLVEPFTGLTGSAGLVYPFLELGRFALTGRRAQEFSFDPAEAYFIENTLSLSYTHRVRGQVDVQLIGARSVFDYGFRANEPAHQANLDTVNGSLGYNLRNRTRVSLNYEYQKRHSEAFAKRNYERRRVYLGWGYGF